MSDNQELNIIIKNKQISDLSQWSLENKDALLKAATSKHKAQFIHNLIKKNSQHISLEQLEQVIYQSIGLSNSTIIHKLIDSVSLEHKVFLIKKAIEKMLFLDDAAMLYKILLQFPSLFKQSILSCLSYIPQILGTFFFKKHLLGLGLILKYSVSNEDINFSCRRAAKDNQPNIVEIFISGFAEKLEPMTQGVVLINLAHFGQFSTLSFFFNKIIFRDQDYLERALVKAVRQGHTASVGIILSQPIEWTEVLIERAMDAALIYKQDDCLFKLIELKNTLLLPKSMQNLILDAYANGCVKTVNLLLDSHFPKIWNKTKGELLLFATKNNDTEHVKKLILSSEKSKIKAPYKQQAYFIALKANNGLQLLFEQAYSGIGGTVKENKLKETSKLTKEINQTLTFQFSRLRISKKELVEESKQTRKPTKCAVVH